jgi:tetratricopeptide (TPR) repeat protein
VITGAVGLVMGFVVSIWPVTQDISFRDALESGDALKIESATDKFPDSGYYYIYGAQILQENKLEDKALEMAKKAIEINPRDFNAWKLLAANPTISESERASAIAKMKELDPFNDTLGD